MNFARRLAGTVLPEPLKRLLRKAAPPTIVPPHASLSFAQEGEDRILASLFSLDQEGAQPGFYVDVGAHHPERFSNTALLARRGWRGINIDPLPGAMDAFAHSRPNDVNLPIGISGKRQTLKYYRFNEPALNGFSAHTSDERNQQNGAVIVGTTDVQTLPLSDVLAEYVPTGGLIDFLNVDVEGLDLDVLKSNDWSRFQPIVIAIEDSDILTLADIGQSAVASWLAERGYAAYCKTPLTTFFIVTAEVEDGILGLRLPRYDGIPRAETPARP